MGNKKSVSAQPFVIRAFRDIPIKQKLLVIIMVTTAVALLLAGLGIVVSNTLLFRKYLERDLTALARILADNSTASLTFNDPDSADEMLAALKAKPHIMAACIYREDGTMLAKYLRAGTLAGCPPATTPEEVRGTRDAEVLARTITLGKSRLGILVLSYDLDEINERMKLYGVVVLGILLASSLIALLFSSELRSAIATPISQLANAATLVSDTRDYSIRAQKISNDELGVLVDAFNEMLARIELRDDELRKVLLSREQALREAQSARKDLQHTNENLARSNEDLERFAFVASHDLQEPLRMITVYSQLLVRSYTGDFDDQASQFVNNIVGGTKRMRELLGDLLAFTEIGARQEEPAQTVDLNFVLQEAKQNLKASIDESGALITADLLPAVSAHPGQFVSIFQNLIGNAIKYRSEMPLRIHISAQDLDGQLQFAVTDNGMGIEPEYHRKIFGAFKRLHGNKIPGTGIGLAICQRIVERYGGRIWVESQAGQGAAFIFTFPGTLRARSGEEN